MTCICGHGGVVHHGVPGVGEYCSLCIEEGRECKGYVHKTVVYHNSMFKICDACGDTFPEMISRCHRCGNENLRAEYLPA